ncbi:ATP-binding protein [Christensenellaceae bacterium 44-20]
MGFVGAFDSIERASEKQIKAEQGDYIVDGLLYCGKCHTPKQARVVILGFERTPMCLCKCAAERKQREAEEEKRREFERRVKELRWAGFPESQMEQWTFENSDSPNSQYSLIAKRYVANFAQMRADGKGLLLFGDVGVGKTFLAACIVNALINQGVPCLMTNFARLTNTLSGMFEGKQEYIDKLNSFPLVVIDDLGAERDTEYVGEIVHNIIDSRCREGLPLIITTNLDGKELENPKDIRKRRVYSRLFEMCIPVKFGGEDRRQAGLKENFGRYADVLGL